MLNAHIMWFGPNLNNASARQRLYSSLRKHCGEETEQFNVFGMMYNPADRNEFMFFVEKRLFFGFYVDQSLLVIEDDHLNIRQLISLLDTREVMYDNLHFREEFDDHLSGTIH